MRRQVEERKAEKIINLTKKTLSMYDISDGTMYSLLPSVQKLPKEYDGGEKVDTYYICTMKQIKAIAKSGRSLKDIARVKEIMMGRNNERIAYIVSAEDRNVWIRLFRNHSEESIVIPD